MKNREGRRIDVAREKKMLRKMGVAKVDRRKSTMDKGVQNESKPLYRESFKEILHKSRNGVKHTKFIKVLTTIKK